MMKRSRKFENVLDECLERLLVKGETVEQCLRGFPEHADELKPLLETALATKKASAIQPRPELKDKVRYQLYLALQGMEPRKRYLTLSWQPRWATAVAIVLALLLVGGGTVAAAGGSMPDEPLYPVKLATEQVQLVLTPSTLGKAELYAKLADRRVSEIIRIAGENKPEQIERTSQRLDAHLTKIASLASTHKATGGVIMTPPPQKAPATKEALIAGEAPLPPEQAGRGKEARIGFDRRARLKATVVGHAMNHPARLRALLDTVPESARPALLRAIALSERDYEKALESFD